jgi:hypothetical protein
LKKGTQAIDLKKQAKQYKGKRRGPERFREREAQVVVGGHLIILVGLVVT